MVQENQQLTAVVDALVTTLGPDWTTQPASPDEQPWSRTINGPDGMGLWIASRTYPAGKIEAQGVYPRRQGTTSIDTVPYGVERPRVACSDKRDPDRIARDIIRRLLPEYQRVYALAVARAADMDDYATRQQAAQTRVCAAMGDAAPLEWNHDRCYSMLTGAFIVTPDNVRFECLTVTIEQAEQIAAILRRDVAQ